MSYDVPVNGIVLYHILMQCRQPPRAPGTDGHGRTRTDVGGNNGEVGKEVGGWKAASRGQGACFRRAIMDCAST